MAVSENDIAHLSAKIQKRYKFNFDRLKDKKRCDGGMNGYKRFLLGPVKVEIVMDGGTTGKGGGASPMPKVTGAKGGVPMPNLVTGGGAENALSKIRLTHYINTLSQV